MIILDKPKNYEPHWEAQTYLNNLAQKVVPIPFGRFRLHNMNRVLQEMKT